MSYNGGVRAAIDLRTLILECLRSGGEVGPNLDIFIHVYTRGESPNTPMNSSTKELLAEFRRGFNASDPLSTYEDPIDGGPSGAGGKSPCSSSMTVIAQPLTIWHNRPAPEEPQS